MGNALDALVSAFLEHRHRLAVFDRQARLATGQWELDRPVRVREIIHLFTGNETLARDGRVIIPIHEADEAELTGEFVVYRRMETGDVVSFFDFSAGAVVDLPVDEFARSYPARRLRFWHPDTVPPKTPSFVRESVDREPSARQEGASSPSVAVPTSAVDESELFERLSVFVEEEREAQRRSVRERYERSPGASFFDGSDGLRDLRPAGRRVDDEGNQVCIIERPDGGTEVGSRPYEDVGIREDIEVLIDAVGGAPGFPVEGVVKSIEGRSMAVWIRWTSSSDHAAAEDAFDADGVTRFRVIKLLDPVPFDRQRKALEEARGDERKWALVAGNHRPTFGGESSIDPRTRHRLNQYQLRALRRSLEADDVVCIHGPPGTGKTRTLVELIREAVYDGAKVLACAHSNQAVDNLLVGSSTLERADKRSLHAAALDGEFDMARAGNNSDNEVVKEYYDNRETWGVNVVGATTSAAHRFRPDEFDLVVLDEASQATIPASIIPFTKGERLVLAGDHKQLPPYVAGELDEEERTEISLFEHLMGRYGDGISTMLRRQYRMHETIAAFPNEAFYDGRLTHGQRNRTWTIGDLDPLVGVHVDGVEERTPAGSYYNEDEIDVVVAEVERLLDAGVLPGQIGVISPYSGQVGKLCASLNGDVLDRGLQVSTVDAFQGSEREAIVVSFVRSNARGDRGFLDFPVEGARRLNVALSRARKRLVLIGNWETLTASGDSRDDGETCVGVYRDLYAHLVDGGHLPEVLT